MSKYKPKEKAIECGFCNYRLEGGLKFLRDKKMKEHQKVAHGVY